MILNSDFVLRRRIRRTRIVLCGLWAALEIAGVGGVGKSWAEKPSSESEGQLPEIIIKGGEKTGVKSEKPLLNFEMGSDDPVKQIMGVEEEPLTRMPESLRNPRAGYSEFLNNNKIILPSRIHIARDPIKVFYPLREILAVSPSLSQEIGPGWEMVVTNEEGRSFRRFSGKSLPPASYPWDGRSDRGEIASVGRNYSIVINYKNTRGQKRNFVGEPFSFDGIIHQEQKGLVLSLSLNSLYAEKKLGTKESLSESGIELLKESADWIKRYYFNYPIQVECFSMDPVALEQAQVFAKSLTSELLLPHSEISASRTPTDRSSERLEIIITNR